MFLIPHFSLDLPQEPPTIIESNRVPAYWPSSSNNSSLIVVENLEIKYAPDLPAVLQNISFSLKAGERVGLLGRTGLSSLVSGIIQDRLTVLQGVENLLSR
jgi:ABC-type multidrug transport system fused ATPase/permease subunit